MRRFVLVLAACTHVRRSVQPSTLALDGRSRSAGTYTDSFVLLGQ